MRALAAKVFSADIQITLREIAASYDALERLADDRARSPSSAARDRTVSQKAAARHRFSNLLLRVQMGAWLSVHAMRRSKRAMVARSSDFLRPSSSSPAATIS